MKLFLDTASLKDIKYWHEIGILDGITTNPTSLAKEGGNVKEVIQKICKLMPNCPISVEVTQEAPEALYHQACEIAHLAKNVVVKIPCHRDYYPVIKRLAAENVPLNITLVFTLIQSVLMAKLGAQYVSPFIGRWEEIDVDGIALLSEIRDAFDEYGYETEILAASMRSVRHVHDALIAGADIVTVPAEILEKMTTHPLTEQGIKKFLGDWKKLGDIKFP